MFPLRTLQQIGWLTLFLALAAGCAGEPPSEELHGPEGSEPPERANSEGLFAFPEAEWTDPDLWLELEEGGIWPVPEGDEAERVVSRASQGEEIEWGLNESDLTLRPLGSDFFDSLSVATRGRSPEDWTAGRIFPFGSGTVQQYSDTLSGWFVLVLRDAEGKPFKWPIYRSYVQLIASTGGGGVLFGFQNLDVGPSVVKLCLRWERR